EEDQKKEDKSAKKKDEKAEEKVEDKKEEKSDDKEVQIKGAGKKKRDRKRKVGGINIDESRAKKRHERNAGISDSGTESDERTLAQRIKQRTLEETSKKIHQKFSKGKSSETIIDESSEAQNIPDIDIPLSTVLPEPNPVYVSSSTSPDTAELDKEADELIKECVLDRLKAQHTRRPIKMG
ncbi:hypothetical protein A2U01_0046773, partial [Trifolium medium]|nr:hypothetical protein [Trifolium medium]